MYKIKNTINFKSSYNNDTNRDNIINNNNSNFNNKQKIII